METFRSACPYDCPDTCGLLVTVDNGRAVAVAGDPAHPYSRGRICAKMLHYERTVHSPRRLTTPLIRSGPKGSGQFTPTTWEKAIDLIAAHWRQIILAHGAEAILPYSYAGTMGLVQRNSGHPFFHRLGASRLERTICTPAKEVGWRAVMGDTPAIHPDEATTSDLIILWGINAASTSIQFMHRVAAARRNGTTGAIPDDRIRLLDGQWAAPTPAAQAAVTSGRGTVVAIRPLAPQGPWAKPFTEAPIWRFSRTVMRFRIARPSATARTSVAKSSSVMTIFAACFATSVPLS